MPNKIRTMTNLLEQGDGPSDPSRYIFFIAPPKVLQGNVLSNIGGSIINAAVGQEAPELPQIVALSLQAEAISIPGKQMLTTPFFMYGTEQKLPYGVAYDDFTVRFLCTNSMRERSFFDQWHSGITNPMSNNWNFYDDYVTSLHIIKVPPGSSISDLDSGDITKLGMGLISGTGVDEAFNSLNLYYCKIEEAYPVTIQSQELSYETDTGYLTLSVQFAYRRWRSNTEALRTISLF